MGKHIYAGVSYTTIDGKQCKPENIYGYCKAHQGILTYPLVQLHRCKCRKDGKPCMHLISFERKDNRYESALTGDEFRASLGRKGKRKGERKRERHPTQCQRLLKYLVLYKKITPLEAWSKLGIYRLPGRIFDLKEKGVGIKSSKTDVTNVFGEKCSVALYELTSVPDGMIEF